MGEYLLVLFQFWSLTYEYYFNISFLKHSIISFTWLGLFFFFFLLCANLSCPYFIVDVEFANSRCWDWVKLCLSLWAKTNTFLMFWFTLHFNLSLAINRRRSFWAFNKCMPLSYWWGILILIILGCFQEAWNTHNTVHEPSGFWLFLSSYQLLTGATKWRRPKV